MKYVYLLQHVHILNKNDEDIKVIGIYESEEAARTAVRRLISQPGDPY